MIGRCTHSKEREKRRRKNGADGLTGEGERERKDDDQTCFCSLPFTKVKVTQLARPISQTIATHSALEGGSGAGNCARARLVAWHLDPRRIGGRVVFVVMVVRSAEAIDMTEKKCRCVASKAAGRLSRSDQEGDGGRRVRT